MKKASKICLILSLILATLLAFTACKEYAPFINPEGTNGPVAGENRYVISVTSAGGLPLSGVKVTAKKDGAVVKSGISVNGKIELSMPLDEYSLEFSSLPAGYYIEEGKTYTTSADSYEYEAIFPSKVIESGAPTSLAYKLGDVMYDFRFTDTDDNAMWLSDLVETNKAVILNFWYRSCGPCRSEFPALERSYQAYSSKLKILALSNQDRQADIAVFKESGVEIPLTFSLGQDTMGLTDAFGVNAFPTTVVVDRYGVIAYVHSGSITSEGDWKALFDTYTSDNYVQTPAEDEGGEDDSSAERVLPTGTMPSSADIAAAIADIESFEGRNLTFRGETEDEYSWPWAINADGKSVSSTNTNIDNSYAILYAEFDVVADDRLVFDYEVSTEKDDILYVILNGELAASFSGLDENNNPKTGTYNRITFSQVDRVSLAFVYQKDIADMLGTDTVTVKNLRLTDIDDVIGTEDVIRYAAKNPNASSTAYTAFKSVELGEDGFYYVTNEHGVKTLLYTDLSSPTQWARLRYGTNLKFTDGEGNLRDRSVWLLSFWILSESVPVTNPDEQLDYAIIYGEKDYTEYLSEITAAQGWIGYYPVDQKLRTLLEDFAYAYYLHPQGGGGIAPNANTWLEFCCYFDHIGPDHPDNGSCLVTDNLAMGMTFDHPFEIEVSVEKDDITAGTVIATGEADNRYPIAGGRGVRHRFVAPKSGVYAFRSNATTDATDATLWLYDSNFNLIAENDECRDYDRFDTHPTNNAYYKYIRNFGAYVYLEEGEVCYPIFAMSQPQTTGKYPYSVSYEGESATKILHCTTGEGLYTYNEITGELIFLGVPVIYNDFDDTYYHIDANGDEAGAVYIDFIRPNFFDQNGHSVYEMIENGIFGEHTEDMREYYQRSINGKTESDPYYGLLPVSQKLVNILNELVNAHQEEGSRVQGWRQFALYDAYYGPEA